MFTAHTPTGDLLYLPDLNRKDIQELPRSIYYCPDCNAPVILKKGNYKIPHFAHFKTCSSNLLSPIETQQHLAGKHLLYSLFSNYFHQVQLEYYFPLLKQRADLYLGSGLFLVVEYQCSSITATEVISRTDGYRRLGYTVRWLLHPQFLPENQNALTIVKLSKFMQSCLHTHKNEVRTLTFLDPDTQSITMLVIHMELNQDYYLVERIQQKLTNGTFILQQPVHRYLDPQTVTKAMQEHYERRKRHLFSYFKSSERQFHFLVKKWKKTEQTLPGYIGLPSIGPQSLGCEFIWQFKLINYLVTHSYAIEPLTRETVIENFLLSLPNRTPQTQETVQTVSTYYDFLKHYHLPEKPFYKSNASKPYMEAWCRFQLLAKPSKH